MKQRTFLAVIFLAALLFLAAGISQLAVTDPVESNYALTALEMVRSGDWISPQIYGTYWYDKPIFLYWLLSLAYSLFGMSDFAARLPAVLFGAASCTLSAWFALRQTGRHVTALLFAAMTATSLGFWFISRSVITDQPLFFFSAATLSFAYIGLTEGRKSYIIAAYGAAALAVLTKGPVGLVLPGLFLLVFAAVQRRSDYVKRLFPPLGLLLFAVLVLSWYGPMYSRHGMDFLDGLLGFNNVVRATVSEHPEYDVWYYYLVLVPLSLLPWIGPCLYGLRQRFAKSDEYVFMVIWAGGTVLFYSLMATKYPTYAYIANWPLLYLGARTVQDWLDEDAHKAWFLVLVPATLYSLLFASLVFFTGKAPFPVQGLTLLTVFLIIMTILTWLAFWQHAYPALPCFVVITTVMTYLMLTYQVLTPFYQYRSAQSLSGQLPQGAVYFFEEYRTSYPYYTGRSAVWTAPASYDENTRLKRDAVWSKKHLYPTEYENSVLSRIQKHEPLTLVVPEGRYKDYQTSNFAPLLQPADKIGAYYIFVNQ
ncbi:MAG: ArnT family glycosyltransferase [Megasphaera sp.]|uniref:ArnT family glycosyltransferase n=1 Tax=Megasphaera sp. TaxID=2023260 RepID=UPI003F04BBCB